MKILHTVEFYDPSPGGAQEVVKQLSERMAAAGHDVTVATTRLKERTKKTINGVKIAEFACSGNTVVGMGGETKRYQDFLRQGDFDIMMNYAAQQWATDLVYDIIDEIPYKKVISPCGYSALRNPDFKDYFAKLPAILRQYDASTYVSSSYQDIVFARQHHLRNLHVIPNGANEKEFLKRGERDAFRRKHGIDGFMMMSIGNHTGAKGHYEMMAATAQLDFPATLVIQGKLDFGCLKTCQRQADIINRQYPDKRVIILQAERAETVQALWAADVFLLLSNVEASPVVLFEALAVAIPFISTDVGNAREIARWTSDGLIAKTSPDVVNQGNAMVYLDDAVRCITKLYKNPALRRRMGERGRRAWEEKFTWDAITKQYLELYERILK